MTIASATNKSGPYFYNGSATSFAYQFKISNEAHIRVVETVTATGVETDLVLNTDYTVTGVDADAGGNVVISPARAAGKSVVMVRNTPFTQDVVLENQGAYFAKVVEGAFDDAAARDQQLAEQISRAVLVPVSADAIDLETLIGGVVSLLDNVDAVVTVAGIAADVTAVAADAVDIGTVAGISGAVVIAADNMAAVSTVAGISAAVSAVAGIQANVSTVAGIAAAVTAVAGISANVTTVATNIAAVNTASTNIAAIIAAPAAAAAAAGSASAAAASAASINPATLATLTSAQTLTNKTLTTPTLVLKQSTTPTPTAEGDIQWDTDDDMLVIGNGSSQKIFRSNRWEDIGYIDISAPQATADFMNLGAYRSLKAHGVLYPATAGSLGYRTSSNNSTFDSGASDYFFQTVGGDATALTGSRSNGAQGSISVQSDTNAGGTSFEILIRNFNKALPSRATSWAEGTAASAYIVGAVTARNQSTARNALRFLYTSGNIASGYIFLEGLKG